MPKFGIDMQYTQEWWHRMVEMHARLVENYDADILQEFKQNLDTIQYVYAQPYEGLGNGALSIDDIAYWYDNVSKWSAAHGDYNDAEKYLERALDYYCDPMLDYDDDIIDEARERMRDLVENCLLGIYNGCHEIYEY